VNGDNIYETGTDTLLLILYHDRSNPARFRRVHWHRRAIDVTLLVTSCPDACARRSPRTIFHKLCGRNLLGLRRRCTDPVPVFVEAASPLRIRPALHEWLYYRVEILADLFSRALLVRPLGRPGTEGHRRLELNSDPVPNAAAATGRDSET
jgi:hypothetical protein